MPYFPTIIEATAQTKKEDMKERQSENGFFFFQKIHS
jgi:hypothetical protein